MLRMDQNGIFREDTLPGIQEILLDMGMDGFGMYYVPEEKGPKSSIGVVIMHCDQNYMGLAMGPQLAAQGYQVFACDAGEGGVIDEKFLKVDRGIRFLKDHGAGKVILMGHSGGATLMSAYQAIAENGPAVFRGEEKIWKCTVSAPLLPADGVMLIDANYGNGVMFLLSLDPAVTTEGDAVHLDPAWDIFSAAHGFRKGDPEGSVYPQEFVSAYRQAQVERNERIIRMAEERLRQIEAGEGNYLDDEPFVTAAGSQIKPNNRMLPQDLRILSHTKRPHALVHGTGAKMEDSQADGGRKGSASGMVITNEMIHGVRVPEFDHSLSSLYGPGANRNTVKGFLSGQAIHAGPEFAITRTEVVGVDWNSSYASPIGNVQHMSAPLLCMGMTGSYEYLAAEMIYDHAASRDRSIAFVHGATHVFTPNHQAEKVPGEFGDTEKAMYRYLGNWLEKFL